MGKRRELFFKEQLFVLQGIDITKDFDLQTRTENECPGKVQEVTSPDSISMSMLLGWEDVMPSLASQISHGGRRMNFARDGDFSEKVEEMKEATDSTDTNFAHSSQQSFCTKRVRNCNHSLLTLQEAAYVSSHMKQYELSRDAYEFTDTSSNFNVDESTEYGRRLFQVSGELRAYEQGNSTRKHT